MIFKIVALTKIIFPHLKTPVVEPHKYNNKVPPSSDDVFSHFFPPILFRGLFNDAVSDWMKMNGVEKILKEAVVACFKILPYYLPGGTGENHKKAQVSRS
jgi:hypothetical protein